MKRKTKHLLQNLPSFLPIGHRGAPLLAPQNSLASFRALKKESPTAMLELDVWPSREGCPIVTHESDLKILTNGSGLIYETTLASLKSLDSGYKISFDQNKTFPFRNKGYGLATLEEILTGFPDSLFSIDIKFADPFFTRSILDLIRKKGMDTQITLGSFHEGILVQLQNEAPHICRTIGSKEIKRFLFGLFTGTTFLNKPKGDIFMVPQFSNTEKPEFLGKEEKQGFRVVTDRFLKTAGHLEIPTMVWTINKAENMASLVQQGVQGIVTDDIKTLNDVLA